MGFGWSWEDFRAKIAHSMFAAAKAANLNSYDVFGVSSAFGTRVLQG